MAPAPTSDAVHVGQRKVGLTTIGCGEATAGLPSGKLADVNVFGIATGRHGGPMTRGPAVGTAGVGAAGGAAKILIARTGGVGVGVAVELTTRIWPVAVVADPALRNERGTGGGP